MRALLVACLLVGCSDYTFKRACSADEPCPGGQICDETQKVPQCVAAPDAMNPPDVYEPPTDCPAFYLRPTGFSMTKYRLNDTRRTWLEAAVDCEDDILPGGAFHTHLAVFDDDTERSPLNAQLSGMYAWIGLSDRKMPGVFKWVTAEPTMGYPPGAGSPWAAGEPSGGANKGCVSMNGVADFVHEDCTNVRRYFCECDAYANDPNRY